MVLEEISNDEIEEVYVSKLNSVRGSGTSKGMQLKWYSEGRFVKLNSLGYEDIAEVLVSHFLRFTDLRDSEFVVYYPCKIYEDGNYLGVGCYSYDYGVNSGVKYLDVSVGKMLKKRGKSFGMSYEDLLDFLYNIVGFNCKGYIDKILCLDCIIRNDDRHFNNINFLYKDDRYIPAPIYDNGCSCMSDIYTYPMEEDFHANYESIIAKPFKSSFEKQLVNNSRLLVDYEGFFNSVRVYSEEAKRALRVIKESLDRTEGIAWERF